VYQLELENFGQGATVIPASVAEKSKQGEVIAIGEETVLSDGTLYTPKVKVGDRIIFQSDYSKEVTAHGKDYLILKASDIFATITE
jgi:chaperonin GroES